MTDETDLETLETQAFSRATTGFPSGANIASVPLGKGPIPNSLDDMDKVLAGLVKCLQHHFERLTPYLARANTAGPDPGATRNAPDRAVASIMAARLRSQIEKATEILSDLREIDSRLEL